MIFRKPEPEKKISEKERRSHKRLKKNFILKYFNPETPTEKYEISQLKNISMGGMCFITTFKFNTGTPLGIALKTPYISDITYLQGKVLESHEKIKDMLYETRLQFDQLNSQAEFLLPKMIEYFLDGEQE